jgi:hypothetical protein
MAALCLAAAAAAAALGGSAAAALGPSPSGLYDCAESVEHGCFKGSPGDGIAFPQFRGGPAFIPFRNRDSSPNPTSGTTLERCAQFCATNYYTLSAVSTNFSAPEELCLRPKSGSPATCANLTVTRAICSCGNSTAAVGGKLASSACAAGPIGGGNYTHPPATCAGGATSCGCDANYSQSCGMVGVSRVYAATCTPSHGPGRYLCPLQAGQYMENGSDVSYQSWVDCFGQAMLGGVPTLGVPPIDANGHYELSPYHPLMCNVTQDPSSWYCTSAVESLRRFANDPASISGYHTYENLLAYQAVIDAGVKAPLNASELAAFQSIMYKGVLGLANYATRVENHCVDIAVQQLYMMKIFPTMNCSGCTLDAATKDKLMRVPNQILANWLHGHALDEYAIGYDAITMVRLVVVLEMMDTTDDLHNDNWRDFVLRFADSITPTGCFSNHV